MTTKESLVRSLNIVQGQIGGITKMIDEEQDCIKILTQMKAIKAGLNRISEDLAKNQLLFCMNKIKPDEKEKYVDELIHTWSRY